MKTLASFLAFLMVVIVSARARAQTAPEIEISGDPVVELGGTGSIKLQVSSHETATDPSLTVSPNLAVVGRPSLFQVDLRGMTNQRVVVATFTVQGKSLGNGTVTPTVQVGGKRFSGKPVTVKVVPAGTGPQKRPAPHFNFPFGPGFDPFKDFFGDDDPKKPQEDLTPTDPKLTLDFAPAPIAFLHAKVDKTRAVVGEQLLFEIDLYVEADRPEPEFADAHEATLSRFVRRSLIDDSKPPETLGFARVGGSLYRVTRVRRAALFPLEAGDLEIGAMSLAMSVGHSRSAPRTTEPITIHVSEPPAQGRPTGYVLGTVGELELKGEVTPREVKRGDVISVRLELSGKGNIPAALPIPVRGDLEFLEPEMKDQIGRLDIDHWGGVRAFSYVVRMKREGEIDLGSISLPFWNPEKRAYEVARAELGKVRVLPGAYSDDDEQAKSKLAGLGAPRASLAGLSPRSHPGDAPLFWGLLVAPALVFASAAGARSAIGRARDAARKRSASPQRELSRRAQAVKTALAGSDARAADAAIVRALEQAAIARRDVNVRGTTKDEARAALEAAGVKPEIARELVAVLRACEEARFSPDENAMARARERWERAEKVLEAL